MSHRLWHSVWGPQISPGAFAHQQCWGNNSYHNTQKPSASDCLAPLVGRQWGVCSVLGINHVFVFCMAVVLTSEALLTHCGRIPTSWWASICGVAQSRTRLKQRSSSSRVSRALEIANMHRPCILHIQTNLSKHLLSVSGSHASSHHPLSLTSRGPGISQRTVSLYPEPLGIGPVSQSQMYLTCFNHSIVRNLNKVSSWHPVPLPPGASPCGSQCTESPPLGSCE